MGDKKLWLTYAWKDNERNDIDYIAQELKAASLDVRLDKFRLVTGRSLWSQIEKEISDPELSAWAIYTTETSLASPACREEMDYALLRALEERDRKFPLIGIFSGNVDVRTLPSAIRSRLCVSLKDPDWKERVISGVLGVAPRVSSGAVLPYDTQWHNTDKTQILEVWPRVGVWHSFGVLVPKTEVDTVSAIGSSSRGYYQSIVGENVSEIQADIEGNFEASHHGCVMRQAIDANTTAKVVLKSRPSEIWLVVKSGSSEFFYRIE